MFFLHGNCPKSNIGQFFTFRLISFLLVLTAVTLIQYKFQTYSTIHFFSRLICLYAFLNYIYKCKKHTYSKFVSEQKIIVHYNGNKFLEKNTYENYDIYGINPHSFGFSETSDFVNFKNLGHFNEGVMKSTNFSSPKHPTVIQITKKEARKLAKKWNCKIKF